MAEDNQESRLLRREVDEAIVTAKQAMDRYQQSGAVTTVNPEVHAEVRNATIKLYNTLRWWRDDPQVNDVWADHNLDRFGQLLTTRVNVGSSGNDMLTSPDSQETRLAVAKLETEKLASVINGLLEVAKELGFAPETSEKTVLEKGTLEDIRWLVNTRNQDKAVEELEPPENDPEALPDGGVAASNPRGSTPEPTTDGPEETTERYPFRGPFFQLVAERKSQGKDAKIAVASANAETGVGKSTCAYYLAHVLDTSPDGYDVDEKATLGVDEFLGAYDRLPKGSALILDEAEQLTGRRAMATKNVKAGERWQMRRVQEICSLLTLPKFSVLDPLMKDLVDFRVEIERRGKATIYKKSHAPFGDTWWQAIQTFEYPDMDGTRGMQTLHQLKDEFLDEEDEAMLSESDAKEEVEKSVKEARRDDRDEYIVQWYSEGHTQQEIADKLDEMYGEESDLSVSRRQVGNILKERGEK